MKVRNMRSTLTDIARESGRSLATVDRVMNERDGVSLRTRSQVLAVARRLGYLMSGGDIPSAAPRAVQLVFVLPEGTNAYVNELERQVHVQVEGLENVTARFERVPVLDPMDLARQLIALREEADGVGIVAVDHPSVREAMRSLMRAGVALVTIASDIQAVPHQGYIGIDNGQAGRLAGYLLARLIGLGRAAKVAVFAGSLAYRGHQEREMGFRHILGEEFAGLSLVDIQEVHEDRAEAEAKVMDLLERHPDLAGIYNAGGANAGIAEALEKSGRAMDTVFVAHDVTEGNTALLLSGTLDAVIDQNARVQIREALSTLTSAARGKRIKPVPARLQVIFRENLPEE
jgi:LacI family transcriptional regulator